MKKGIIKSIIAFSMLSILLTGCSDMNVKLDKDFNKYTKEGSEEYSYDINSDKLSIKCNCGNDITIKKENVDKIKVKIDKSISGNNEEKLNDAVEGIKVTYDNGVINILGPEFNWKDLLSMNNKTEIVIPENINNLDLKSDVGDINLDGDCKDINLDTDIGDINLCGNYENLNLEKDTGDAVIEGELQSCNISSDTGDVKLNLNKIEDNYNYKINADIGSIEISIPNSSKIKLSGKLKDRADISEGINLGNEGAAFDLDGDIATVNITGK